MRSNTIIPVLLQIAVCAGAPSSSNAIWQPKVGNKFQIVISGVPSVSSNLIPGNTPVWDVDLFATPKSTIDALKAQGKRVICYLSAGTSEDWRPDFGSFRPSDLGSPLPCWAGERYLNFRSENVFNVMKKRIQMASELGCDAIDPDNLDAYEPGNKGGGLNITEQDATIYLRKLAAEAAKHGMGTGLKNAEAILPTVQDVVQFAVNEECRIIKTCSKYDEFLASGKPVFHIEYAGHTTYGGKVDFKSDNPALKGMTSSQLVDLYCTGGTDQPHTEPGFSTVVKNLALDGFVYYCDGTFATTPSKAEAMGERPGVRGGRKNDYCGDS